MLILAVASQRQLFCKLADARARYSTIQLRFLADEHKLKMLCLLSPSTLIYTSDGFPAVFDCYCIGTWFVELQDFASKLSGCIDNWANLLRRVRSFDGQRGPELTLGIHYVQLTLWCFELMTPIDQHILSFQFGCRLFSFSCAVYRLSNFSLDNKLYVFFLANRFVPSLKPQTTTLATTPSLWLQSVSLFGPLCKNR